MGTRTWPIALLVTTSLMLAFAGGCGGGGDDAASGGRTDTTAAGTAADTVAMAAADTVPARPSPGAIAALPGRVQDHPEASFSIYWPGGCDRILQSTSAGETSLAASEIYFECDLDTVSYTVHFFDEAHDVNGDPAHPRLVVSMIEERLAAGEMHTLRQRPLEAGGVQGIDVHAEARGGETFAWFRALLVGSDIYLIQVEAGGEWIFERAEPRDFVFSFQLDGG
ncbi:hypothetical protein GF314_13415 [bacterium]|nr:hypothetical protein [bacterium]